jgi:HSP20 family protein
VKWIPAVSTLKNVVFLTRFCGFSVLEILPGDPITAVNDNPTVAVAGTPEANSQERNMNLAGYEPWSVFDLMNRELNRTNLRRLGAANGEQGVADWTPAVDIVEEKERFVVRADVPGVNAADIEVSMDNGVLSVSGERHSEDRSDVDGVQRYERVSGRFYRRFTLPDTADAENITAKSSNGILEISIPKQPAVVSRRIAVQAD